FARESAVVTLVGPLDDGDARRLELLFGREGESTVWLESAEHHDEGGEDDDDPPILARAGEAVLKPMGAPWCARARLCRRWVSVELRRRRPARAPISVADPRPR